MLLVKNADGLQGIETDWVSSVLAFLGGVTTTVAAVASKSKYDKNGCTWLNTLAH